MPGSTDQIPIEVRESAEKSVEQAREAFEDFFGAAQRAVASVGTTAVPFSEGAKDMGTTALTYAEANVKAAFDLAQKLVQAKDAQEVMQLQSDFVKQQFESFQEQAKRLGTIFQDAGLPGNETIPPRKPPPRK